MVNIHHIHDVPQPMKIPGAKKHGKPETMMHSHQH
jgi:hypothetical protein